MPFAFANRVLASNPWPDAAVLPFTTQSADAGLLNGDVLLSVNGRPLKGAAVYGEEFAKSRVGDRMVVTIRRREKDGTASEKTLQLPLVASSSSWLNHLPDLVYVVAAAFLALLGCWVVLVRPRDRLSWLVLALMLSFGWFTRPVLIESWGPVVRDLALAFNTVLIDSLAIWLLLLALYFPKPFPPNGRWARLNSLKWVLITPLGVATILDIIIFTGFLEDFSLFRQLGRLDAHLTPINGVLFLAAVLAVPVCLIPKYLAASSTDDRRRLKLLVVGSMATLVAGLPFLVVLFFGNAPPTKYLPLWFIIVTTILFTQFPVLLAYSIVVHRVMDIRLVLRQGLQYALARNGIRAIQTIVTLIAGIEAGVVFSSDNYTSIPKAAAILMAVAIAFSIRRVAEWLLRWIDRRFFREAYDAEQLLNELGDKVRGMVEPRSLIETVITRLSETLHVLRVAIWLDMGSPYRPAYAVGYEGLPNLAFSSQSATVRLLRTRQEPLRVYLDDSDSWLYREPESTQDERDKLTHLQAELLLPLTASEKLLGFISLGRKQSEEPFTRSDLRLLKSIATQTGLALENAQLLAAVTEEARQRERLNRELEIAREVQERLFPQELPAVAGLDYSGACRPALGVGGDYYDFLALSGDRLGIAIGDVSGKGIGAALLMASLQASLRGEVTRCCEDISGLVANVNRLVFQASNSNRYATFFYAQYEAGTCQLTYVNAGHNPPMLFRPIPCGAGETSWQVTRLCTGGPVVGLLLDSSYRQESITLNPGDMLVAFTDGISEALNLENEEWGEERLAGTITGCEAPRSHELLADIMKAADQFASGAKQYDDMTLVVLRMTGKAAASHPMAIGAGQGAPS